jgi:hypothetical protein
MHRLPVLAFAALLVTAFVLPGPIPPHQQIAYRLPSPPTATYHVTDTTRVTVASPMGPVEASRASSFTFTATFAAEGDGVRVSGELTEFEAQGTEPMRGTTSISRSQAGVGDFDLVLGPRGVTEMVAGALQGADGELPMWADPTEGMFPSLPSGEIQPGDTWVDTVTGHVAGNESKRVAGYTYTLAGDTVVDGRPHLKVSFSGDIQLLLDEGGGSTDELTGTETGFFLWDVGRGLVARAEVSRSYEGSIEMGAPTPMSMKTTAVTRVTLQM